MLETDEKDVQDLANDPLQDDIFNALHPEVIAAFLTDQHENGYVYIPDWDQGCNTGLMFNQYGSFINQPKPLDLSVNQLTKCFLCWTEF